MGPLTEGGFHMETRVSQELSLEARDKLAHLADGDMVSLSENGFVVTTLSLPERKNQNLVTVSEIVTASGKKGYICLMP